MPGQPFPVPDQLKIFNGESSIFLLPIFLATQIRGGAKELLVLL